MNNDPSNLELWVKTQPCGQRVTDRVAAAMKLLKDYPELTKDPLAGNIAFHSAAEYDRFVGEYHAR